MIRHQHDDLVWFQFASLTAQAGDITHGVFSRRGGVSLPPFASLNAGPGTPDDPTARNENYRRIRATLPGDPLLVGSKPSQGSVVREVVEGDLDRQASPVVLLPMGCDAFITQVAGIGLFWAVADCSVILLIDQVHHAIGLVHAGWRGTAGTIVRNALDALHQRYHTEPRDVLVAIAPTIGPCCYEVDDHVRAAFRAEPLAEQTAHFSTMVVRHEDGSERPSLRLDVAASNQAQLIELGVPPSHIEMSGMCTGSTLDLFYSHRMEGGNTGRFAVVLGLKG